jgi:hypothetical protein
MIDESRSLTSLLQPLSGRKLALRACIEEENVEDENIKDEVILAIFGEVEGVEVERPHAGMQKDFGALATMTQSHYVFQAPFPMRELFFIGDSNDHVAVFSIISSSSLPAATRNWGLSHRCLLFLFDQDTYVPEPYHHRKTI